MNGVRQAVKKWMCRHMGHKYTPWKPNFRDIKKLRWMRSCKRCGIIERVYQRPKGGTMKLTFEVPGIPKAKQRPRFTRTGRTYTPEQTAVYENLVRVLCQQKMAEQGVEPFKTAVRVTIAAFMPMPMSFSDRKKDKLAGKPHTKRPDVDNLSKSVMDGILGVAYADDALVWQLNAFKIYAETPRLEVTIEETEDADHAANP